MVIFRQNKTVHVFFISAAAPNNLSTKIDLKYTSAPGEFSFMDRVRALKANPSI
jgi:hypothetical protein